MSQNVADTAQFKLNFGTRAFNEGKWAGRDVEATTASLDDGKAVAPIVEDSSLVSNRGSDGHGANSNCGSNRGEYRERYEETRQYTYRRP